MRIGVDEAGKGPVLGPMIAAAVGVPDPDVLPEGVADSKRLTPERRQELDVRIRDDDRISVGVAAVDVERIDDPETDMNSLTVAGQAEATRSLLESGRAEGVASDGGSAEYAVLADAGDTSESRFARRLADAIADGSGPAAREDADEQSSSSPPSTTSQEAAGSPAVDARHGADDDDPVVAAASIVAKVERDARVASIAEEYGDVGSGYPSDPTTRAFLEAFVREAGELPGCARRSWQTCDDVLAAAEQSGLGEF